MKRSIAEHQLSKYMAEIYYSHKKMFNIAQTVPAGVGVGGRDAHDFRSDFAVLGHFRRVRRDRKRRRVVVQVADDDAHVDRRALRRAAQVAAADRHAVRVHPLAVEHHVSGHQLVLRLRTGTGSNDGISHRPALRDQIGTGSGGGGIWRRLVLHRRIGEI